jgi:hypothetical protein
VRKILLALAIVGLTGCEIPYGPADTVLNQELVTPKSDVQQTKITVTRKRQTVGGPGTGVCKFLIAVDNQDLALLRENQHITAYLPNGPHKLRVSNECNVLTMGMRKTLDVNADGVPKEYLTEVGFWGQYRLWQVK